MSRPLFSYLRQSLPAAFAAAAVGFGTLHAARAGEPILFPHGQTYTVHAQHRSGSPILVPQPIAATDFERELRLRRSAVRSATGGARLSDLAAPDTAQPDAPAPARARASRQWREEQARKRMWLLEQTQDDQLTAADLEGKHYTAKDLERSDADLDTTFRRALADTDADTDATGRYEPDESRLRPSNRSADAYGSADASLNDLLAPLPAVASDRNSTRTANLLQFSPQRATSQDTAFDLPGFTRSDSSSLGTQDPVNLSPDASSQPLQPLVGTRQPLLRGAPGTPSRLPASSTATVPYGTGGNRTSSRVTGYSSLPSPSMPTPNFTTPTPPQTPKWTMPGAQEPIRRKF